jgi:signal peptidase II
MSRRWKIFLLVCFLSVAADQATKLWARSSLPVTPHGCSEPLDFVVHNGVLKCRGEDVDFISGFWKWRLSYNPGSAFGMFSQEGSRWFLSAIALLAVIGMGWMVKRAKPHQRTLVWALALIAGGALGNFIDRVYFGVVTDFVLWHAGSHEWPVFNVADVVLVVGVGLMALDLDKKKKKKIVAKAKPKTPEPDDDDGDESDAADEPKAAS